MVGIKHDKGKPRIDLVPPGAIFEVAEVLTDGVEEYGAHNWKKGIAYSRLYSATQRHLLAFWKGEDVDQSGHRALAHACTDIMMLMEMSEDWDDRYKQPDKKKVTMLQLVSSYLGVEEKSITPKTLLQNDLGADFLDLVGLVVAVEDEFGVEITDEDAEKIQTIQDIVVLVENIQGNKK